MKGIAAVLARVVAIKVVSRILGYALLGVALNVVLLVAHWNDITVLWQSSSSEAAGQSVVVAVQAFSTVLLLLFFPFVFLVVGQKQGIQAGLHFLVENHAKDFVAYLLEQFVEENPDFSKQASESSASLGEALPAFLVQLEGRSRIFGHILHVFQDKSDFTACVLTAVGSLELSDCSDEEAIERISSEVSAQIPVENWKPGALLPATVLGANLALVYLVGGHFADLLSVLSSSS